MSLQAIATTPVPMHYRLPSGQLSVLLEGLPLTLRDKLAFEGLLTNAEPAVTVRFFLVGGSEPAENRYIADELLRRVKSLGGRPYATGSLYLEEANAVFGPQLVARMRAFRLRTDPMDRLNPGKAFLR